MKLPFSHHFGLYRRNNFGQPCVWYAEQADNHSIYVYHGIVGKTITKETIFIDRLPSEEISSRVKAKRKVGYRNLWEVKDNVQSPVEGELLPYLNAYLPDYRMSDNGALLPMLAKVYDNTNNKLFNRCPSYIGQWKINGLRCFVSATANSGDMFHPIKLHFVSREGTEWNSLNNLEEYLLFVLDDKLLTLMVDENYILDGEVYLPGHTVNEIDHFVKNPKCAENKLVQYWCYDIAIDNTIQIKRTNFLLNRMSDYVCTFPTKTAHLNNADKFVVLPTWDICSNEEAVKSRDKNIDLGFEGLILRNPTAEYQYGKRNLSMIKFKRSTDGKFTIIDIYPEGIKRSNIPLFLLKNDVNDATFEVHVGGNQNYQSSFLREDIKRATIGKQMYVEYGERSGVNQVPFHIRTTYIL